ncbi:hypothetical protein LCM17_18080 [Cereibacter sphaeroides]|nr:hypothetical protein [Cereibacter sphaeroides]
MIRAVTLPALLVLSLSTGMALAQADKDPGQPASSAAPQPTVLGHVGEWTLTRYGSAQQPAFCTVSHITASEHGLWFSADGVSTAFGFSALGSAAIDTTIPVTIAWVGNQRGSEQVNMVLDWSEGFPWRSYRASNAEPDGWMDVFQNASSISFRYDGGMAGQQEASFSLAGSSRAMRAALDCAMPGSSAAPVQPDAATAAAAPRVAGEPYVIRGTCRLVVEGVTYIDRRGDCPIWMENDGSGRFWINTDREGTLPDYFAELSPMGDGTASGHWNGSPGATHAQGFLGEDFRMGAGGCWIGQRATICAAR